MLILVVVIYIDMIYDDIYNGSDIYENANNGMNQ